MIPARSTNYYNLITGVAFTATIYTHVLRRGGSGMKSPLDCLYPKPVAQSAPRLLRHSPGVVARSRLSASTADTCEEMHCASAVTTEAYAIHIGYTPSYHRAATGNTPSARAERSRRGGGGSELDKCG